MDKVALLIAKWRNNRIIAQEQRQEAAMAGSSKKDLNAMDAYIKMFSLFESDLKSLA